jgi:hypothetical protein
MSISSAGFALGLVLLTLWMKKPKRQYLITTFIVLSLLTSLSFLIISLNPDVPVEAKLCRNNAVGLESADGPSLCVVQGVLLVFMSAALSLAWLAQNIDLYLTIVRGTKSTLDKFFYRYMALIFSYPFILVIVYAASGYFGYNGYSPFCVNGYKASLRGSSTVTLVVYYVPIIIIMLSGTLLFLQVFPRLLVVWFFGSAFRRGGSNKVRDSSVNTSDSRQGVGPTQFTGVAISVAGGGRGGDLPLLAVVGQNNQAFVPDEVLGESSTKKKQRSKGMEITLSIGVYCLLFLITWAYLISFRMSYSMEAKKAQKSYDAWVECVFSHYDGESDDSWRRICGEQAEYYKHFYSSSNIPITVLATGQSLMVCLGFLREFIVGFWMWCAKKKVVEEVDREVKRILEIRHSRIRRHEEERRRRINNMMPQQR